MTSDEEFLESLQKLGDFAEQEVVIVKMTGPQLKLLLDLLHRGLEAKKCADYWRHAEGCTTLSVEGCICGLWKAQGYK